MGIKTQRTHKKPKNKTPRLFGNITAKLRPRKNFAHFLTSNNNLPTIEPSKFRTHSNPATSAEIERQHCNGLLYANIARFR